MSKEKDPQKTFETRLYSLEKKVDKILSRIDDINILINSLCYDIEELKRRVSKLENQSSTSGERININRYSNSDSLDMVNVAFSPIKKANNNIDKNKISQRIAKNKIPKNMKNDLKKPKAIDVSNINYKNEKQKTYKNSFIAKNKSAKFINTNISKDILEMKLNNNIIIIKKKDSYCSILEAKKKLIQNYKKNSFSKRISTAK